MRGRLPPGIHWELLPPMKGNQAPIVTVVEWQKAVLFGIFPDNWTSNDNAYSTPTGALRLGLFVKGAAGRVG